MATAAFCHIRTSPVICSISPHSKPEPIRQNQSQSQRVSSSSYNWWTPLFGWSSDPDYIQGSKNASILMSEEGQEISDQSERQMGRPRSKFNLGCFTEEKAKKLRKKTAATSTFHDIMYHSAIASRLASDVPGHQER